MRSLFVVSLPRSLSSTVYHAAAAALNLQEPSWVLDGEILNVDRYSHYQGTGFDESAKFTTRNKNYTLFQDVMAFLDQVTHSQGYIYKDVTQPFVIAEWRRLPEFSVLKIKREITEIASSILRHAWFWPQNVALHPRSTFPLVLGKKVLPFRWMEKYQKMFRRLYESAVIEGLIQTDLILDQLTGFTVHFDDLISDEMHLNHALQTLYPESEVHVRYIDAKFVKYRETILLRRKSYPYQRLKNKIENIRRKMDRSGSVSAQQLHV